MNDALKLLLQKLKQSPKGQPEFKEIANHLDNLIIETKDWKHIFPVLKEHYGFENNEQVVNALVKQTNPSTYEDDFLPLMQEHNIKGWIGEYVHHTMGMEPPTAYHFGVAMALIGSCLQRQIYVPRGYFRIWPTTHILLVGPSADGKTTAGDYGYKLLQQTGRTFPVVGESKQYIHSKLYEVQEQTGNAVGFIYSPELADFIGKDDWKQNLVAYLIRLMDGEDEIPSGSLSRRDQNLSNVGVSFLGCTNIELLDDAVPRVAIGSGFMSRFFIFSCEGTDRVCERPTIPENAAHWDWLKESLLRTQDIVGEMHLDEDAETWYKAWYNLRYRMSFPKDEKLVPFHKRKRNFIIKLAMILSVSDEISTPVELLPPGGYKDGLQVRKITEEHLEQAEAVLDWITDKLPRLYQLLGNSPWAKEQNRIINVIKKFPGGIDIKELSRKVRFPLRRLNEHLQTLYHNGTIGRQDELIFYKGGN